MKNNKNIPREEIKVGMRVKMAIPTFWAYHNNKDCNKKYSWWKGKIISVHPGMAFNVYLSQLKVNMYISKGMEYRIVKCF